MVYPIVIHKDRDSDYGVTVPDLPGCFSAGATPDEAITMAQEAIALHLAGMIEDGFAVPEPSPVEKLRRLRDNAGGTFALVQVDTSKLARPAIRLNITLPQRVLERIDRFAKRTGESRSALLARAASEYIREHQSAH